MEPLSQNQPKSPTTDPPTSQTDQEKPVGIFGDSDLLALSQRILQQSSSALDRNKTEFERGLLSVNGSEPVGSFTIDNVGLDEDLDQLLNANSKNMQMQLFALAMQQNRNTHHLLAEARKLNQLMAGFVAAIQNASSKPAQAANTSAT